MVLGVTKTDVGGVKRGGTTPNRYFPTDDRSSFFV